MTHLFVDPAAVIPFFTPIVESCDMLSRGLLRSLTVLVVVTHLLIFVPPSTAILSDLPRLNLQTFSSESGDMGSYEFFKCKGGADSDDSTSDRKCELSGPVDYIAGAGFYTCLGLIAFVFVFLGSIIFLIYSGFKLCCCCCCRKVEPFDMKRVRSGVKKWSVVSFTICLIMMFVCFCVSTFSGNLAITENTSTEYNAADSLRGVSNIVQSFEPSITHTGLSSTSSVFAPAISKTNKTVNMAMDIPGLVGALKLIDSTIDLLPNPHTLVDSLTATNSTVSNSSDHIDRILFNIDEIDSMVDLLDDGTSHLYNQTLNLTAVNEDLLDSITVLNTSIQDTLDFLDDIVGEDTGIVPLSVADMNAVQRVSEGGLLPNVDTFSSASTAATASTHRVLSGAMNGIASEVETMNEKLIAIDTNISALPNFTTTGDRLVRLNDTINAVLSPSGLMSNLSAQLAVLDGALYGPIPILYDFNDTIIEFEGILANLTTEVGDTETVLTVMLPLIESLVPQFDVLTTEVMKIFNADALLPVLDFLVDQVLGVDATLVEIGEQKDLILNSTRSANETLWEILYEGTITDILDQILDSNTTVLEALADANDELANLRDFEEVLADSVNDYNISEISGKLQDAVDLLLGIDLNDTIQKVNGFTASLEAIVIEEDFVDSLYSLQSSLEGMSGMLDRAVGPTGDYIYLAQGYCTGEQDKYCSSDSDCTTTCNTASKGDFRCSSPIGATPCTHDSNCSSVDPSAYCLADLTRTYILHGVLDTFSVNTSDLDVDSILDDLNEINTKSDVNLTDSTSLLDDGAEAIDLFDSQDMFDLIEEIDEGMTDFDTASIKDQLNTTQSTMNSVGFSGFIDTISEQLDLYDKVGNNGTLITDWLGVLETGKNYLFNDQYLKAYLSNVNDANLNEKLQAKGPSGAFAHIIAQVDRSYEDFRLNQTKLSMKERNESYSSKYRDTFEVLDRMGASRYPTQFASNDQHGALYYIFSLANNSIDGVKSLPLGHPLARGVVADSNGYKYQNDFGDGEYDDTVYCFTYACFEYTIDILNSAPMSEVNEELNPPSYDGVDDDGGSDVPLDVSREELMTLLWVPVLILLFIGVCSLIFAFIPRFQKAHNCCNCCFLSCALVLLPFVFVFSSFFMFLAIIGEDACTTGTAVGESYISLYGDAFCPDKLSGIGTLENCQLNWTLPEVIADDANITISVNVLETYNALLQDECNTAEDPFRRLLWM